MDEKFGRAQTLVESLQGELRQKLEELSGERFERVEWLREGGKYGGGHRFSMAETRSLNRGSINISTIHYRDLPQKPLLGATALSTIIHPNNPHAPSVHMHISWTVLREGGSYWRLMADLNPSHPDEEGARRFEEALRRVNPAVFEEARANGERYFYIPALGRHRGQAHYYLEGFNSGDFAADLNFAGEFGQAAIATYVELLSERLHSSPEPGPEAFEQQLAYHTLYFFQVLTLDRGTTSGILVHDQNDLGILASLPSFIDRELLKSWKGLVEPAQKELVQALLNCLPDQIPTPITEDTRQGLAKTIRDYYRAYPEALKYQARGNIISPTVQNHGG